jgi:hypothetical protein
MNTKYMFIVAALAVMMIGATVLATDDAFAGKYKSKSQAVSQANYCGNGELPSNVWCQNTASQIQGEDNEAALSSSQGARGDECPTCPA